MNKDSFKKELESFFSATSKDSTNDEKEKSKKNHKIFIKKKKLIL